VFGWDVQNVFTALKSKFQATAVYFCSQATNQHVEPFTDFTLRTAHSQTVHLKCNNRFQHGARQNVTEFKFKGYFTKVT